MTEKILVVDDHAETLNLVSVILRRQGYEVFTANSGPSGLQVAESEQPNLILLDVMMPDMDGYEVCRRLREHPRLNRVPIILFTAKSQPGEKWEGFEAGATDYLVKPTNTEELGKRVRTILDSSPRPLVPEDATLPENSTINVESPYTAEMEPQLPGQIIGVMGVRGGSGTTTTAINLAFALANQEVKTLLVDLDMIQGHISMYLNRQVKEGINVLAAADIASLPLALSRQVIATDDNLGLVLTQPNLTGKLPIIGSKQMKYVIQALGNSGKQTIFDLGRAISETTEPVIRSADHLIICIRPERVAVSAAKQLINQIKQLTKPSNRLHVIMLDFGHGVQLPQKAVENFIGHPLETIITIPHQDMAQSVNSGKPLVVIKPQAAAAEAFRQLIVHLIPKESNA